MIIGVQQMPAHKTERAKFTSAYGVEKLATSNCSVNLEYCNLTGCSSNINCPQWQNSARSVLFVCICVQQN